MVGLPTFVLPHLVVYVQCTVTGRGIPGMQQGRIDRLMSENCIVRGQLSGNCSPCPQQLSLKQEYLQPVLHSIHLFRDRAQCALIFADRQCGR